MKTNLNKHLQFIIEVFMASEQITTKRENYCGNCGEEGHTYRRCLAPIISLGVILYKVVANHRKQQALPLWVFLKCWIY